MRLIDADALKAVNRMKDDCADCDKELRGKSKACEFDRVYTKMDFCGWLDDAPTVDAVPVKHGWWWHYEGMLICSECGTQFYDDISEYCGDHVPKFCPNCGAKMDGKDGDGYEMGRTLK